MSSLLNHLDGRLADGDASHAVDHLLRVAAWAVRLTRGEPSIRLAISTALLHDAVNIPKDSPDRARASLLSAELAANLLPPLGFSNREVALAYDAILNHSRSRGTPPRTCFGCAFQDADRLDALGAVGMARSLATGAQLGREIACDSDPWAERRPLAPRTYTLDYVISELLPLPGLLHSPVARQEGWRRVHTMIQLLDAWGNELGFPLPARHNPLLHPEDASEPAG